MIYFLFRKKFYLVLFAGSAEIGGSKKSQTIPSGLGLEGDDKVTYERKREKSSKSKSSKRKNVKDLDWILKKKELYRARGKEGVPRDSKSVQILSDILYSGTRLIFFLSRQVHWKKSKSSILALWIMHIAMLLHFENIFGSAPSLVSKL